MAEVATRNTPIEYYSRGLRERFCIDSLKLNSPIIEKDQTYADIGYTVDENKYHARSQARLRAGELEKSAPNGWPSTLKGPLVWTTSDFRDESRYILQLEKADIAELVEALKYFEKQELNGDEVVRANFPLHRLGQRLETASEDIYEGKGFVIVRGIDPNTFSVEEFTIIYLGISSYIAEKRGKQDQRGSMIMHAVIKEKDELRSYDKARSLTIREYPYILNNHQMQPFHTDTVCDCLGLITRSCSAKGGRSVLSSVWTIYNELAATRPDLIHVLAKPDWPFDTLGRDPPYYRRALLFCHEGKIILNMSRRLLVGHAPKVPRSEGIPGLTEAQAEALDALHFIAEKHEITPTMENGDMRFFNNMAIMHRREAFENDEAHERHLIRLWLKNEDKCWSLPAPLKLAWARVFEDDERNAFWDIEPPKENGRMLRVAGSCD